MVFLQTPLGTIEMVCMVPNGVCSITIGHQRSDLYGAHWCLFKHYSCLIIHSYSYLEQFTLLCLHSPCFNFDFTLSKFFSVLEFILNIEFKVGLPSLAK